MEERSLICIVDGDEEARISLRLLLEASGLHAADYASAADFLAGGLTEAACLVTDLVIPDMDGLALLAEAGRRRSDLPVVIVTGYGAVGLAVRAMKAGAADFLEKPFEAEAILGSIHSALAIAERRRAAAAQTQTARHRLAALTPREKHVLQELVDGHSNKAVAQRLGISPRTVEVYRAQIMNKLEAESLSDLVRTALAATWAVSATGF